MFLDSLKYSQFEGESKEWFLEKTEFNKINLIVGKNASGKTMTLNIIKNTAGLVSGDRSLFTSGNHYLVFKKNDGTIMRYNLEITNKKVKREQFIINDRTLLNRGDNGEGMIWAEELDKEIRFQVPINELACVNRRDSIQHPFFEDLYTWGKNLLHYNFGTPLGKDKVLAVVKAKDNEEKDEINLKDTENVVFLLSEGIKKFGDSFKREIIDDINLLGYNIEDIEVSNTDMVSASIPTDIKVVHIKEAGIEGKITQMELSQGMFRALSLIIQLNLAQLSSTPSCIVIDDIGEGLDFQRSIALINLLIDKVQNSEVQLIMSTNDRFVMNNVPLEYWQVIQRNKNKCHILNYRNSKEIFDEFKFTGLNNFDFFSTEFYLSGLESK